MYIYRHEFCTCLMCGAGYPGMESRGRRLRFPEVSAE